MYNDGSFFYGWDFVLNIYIYVFLLENLLLLFVSSVYIDYLIDINGYVVCVRVLIMLCLKKWYEFEF